MNKLLPAALALFAILSSGCGSVIFNAHFGSGSGSPQGKPAGSPRDDRILVNNPANPVLHAGGLVFESTGHWAYFFSSPVQQGEAPKTLSWKGFLQSGSGPFLFLISSENTVNTPLMMNPLKLRFSGHEVQMIDLPPNNTVLHRHALNPNKPYRVSVNIQLKSELYRVIIRQRGSPEIEFLGVLNPLIINQLKSRYRIVLQAGFLPSSGADQYLLDDVVMKEKLEIAF